MTNSALLLIDVQQAFDDAKWGPRNNPQAEENMQKILAFCRKNNWTIIHVQHISQSTESVFYQHGSGFPIKEIVTPQVHEKIIHKQVNSAFIGTDLDDYLKEKQINDLTIIGLTTPHCVSTTTRMSGNLGYRTYLISDATVAFGMKDHQGNFVDAQTLHHYSLATLHEEFATVIDTDTFLKNKTSID